MHITNNLGISNRVVFQGVLSLPLRMYFVLDHVAV
jgi:hypothetical protein